MVSKPTSQPISLGLKACNSLGFAKPEAETRVVVAMSGGVDSSVAAALLHEPGRLLVALRVVYAAKWVALLANGSTKFF